MARPREDKHSSAEIRKAAVFIIDLYEKLIRNGFMDQDCPEVAENLIDSLFPLVKELKRDEHRKWRESVGKSIHMVKRTVRNPKRAFKGLANRIQALIKMR
jgi:hypothetical protein